MANYCLPNDLPLQLAQLLHVEGESNSANLSQLVEGQCSVACTYGVCMHIVTFLLQSMKRHI